MGLFADIRLAERIEQAERDLILAGAEAIAQNRPNTVFIRPLAGGVAVHTADGSPLNKLAGLGFGGSPSAEEMGEVEQAFAARGCPLQVEVATLAPGEIFEFLTARGFRLVGFEAVLGHEPAEAPIEPIAAPIQVSTIEAAERGLWIDVVVSGFLHPDTQGVASHEQFSREALEPVMRDFAATPGMRQYLAHVDGQPAGGASLRMTQGIAQFCGAATLPAYRRRGVQTSLLIHRLREIHRLQADLGVITTQPGSKSMQNAQRHGFQLLYKRAVLVKSH